MQIGYPTDVKHVAHIGWDGPSVGSPSWVLIYLFILLFYLVYKLKNISPFDFDLTDKIRTR